MINLFCGNYLETKEQTADAWNTLQDVPGNYAGYEHKSF